MPDLDPLERAKADRLELQKQVNRLATEISRIDSLRTKALGDVERLTAFIDLYAKYTDPQQPELEMQDAPATAAPVVPLQSASRADVPSAEPKGPTKAKRRKKTAIATKPKGSPSIPDMIRMALLEAKAQGKSGLEPKDMSAFIARRWWPTVKSARVSPVAWRMKENHDLEKTEDGLYMLPSDEPADLGMSPDQMRAAGIIPMHAKVIGEA